MYEVEKKQKDAKSQENILSLLKNASIIYLGKTKEKQILICMRVFERFMSTDIISELQAFSHATDITL